MSKYFKEEELKKLKLSEYSKMCKSDFQYYVCDEKYRKLRAEYIISIIGDVELDEDTYRLFMGQFDSYGGRYDVRTKRETIKGIYEILQKYPFLSAASLDQIWFAYIHDQFEAYYLIDELGKYFKSYGKTEEALDKYLGYVDEIAKEYDKQFHGTAAKLVEYCEDYDQDLIRYLQIIIKGQHVSLDSIISSLPSKELIDKDKKQLGDIIRQTRIFFGACYPISYQMIESLATGEGLDDYPEQPQYMICGTRKIDTTFTKQEFLESIEKIKVKKLEIK